MHGSRFVCRCLIVAAGFIFAVSESVAVSTPEIVVVSNRADLISGGDALVEIKWPAGSNVSLAKIAVDGVNVKPAFAFRGNGRYMGVVTGLKNGKNVLTARIPGAGAQITITNHPSGGPVFSGAQLQPWICATVAATVVPVTGNPGSTPPTATATTKVSGLSTSPVTNDPPGTSQCETPPTYTYYYKKTTAPAGCAFALPPTANACFTAYTPGGPATVPADAADLTNDRGDTVKYLIRVERGSINRTIYSLVSLYDPRDANVAWAPPKGWNQKLHWKFGPGAGSSRFEMGPGVGGINIMDANALPRGFIVAAASLTDNATNSNPTLAAETMMMVKERIIEQYGEIRYTMGDGPSGGSIMQHTIASAYPGLTNGIQPSASFSDWQTTYIEIGDCILLQATPAQFSPGGYYNRPGSPGLLLAEDQKVAIDGHAASTGATKLGFCNSWIAGFGNAANPRANNCGAGFPAALIYNPTTNPKGIRCGIVEQLTGIVGTFVDTDGVTKANPPRDNVGLQYGLKPLRAWAANPADPAGITPEQFVQLNEGIGGFDADLVWSPSRMQAKPAALQTYYSAGLVSDGRQLAKVPMIDLRGAEPAIGCIHMNWRSLETRDRLDRDHGGHDNQLMWGSSSGGFGAEAFRTMDTWLANIEGDPTANPIEVKVVNNKPAGAVDFCEVTPGGARVGLFDPTCPIKCSDSPHQVAGAPRAENIFKCQLKPFNPLSADYGGAVFDSGQQARLAAVFPDGVCDWSLPGVGQVPVNPWTTFAGGPGGVPLGAPPVSNPIP